MNLASFVNRAARVWPDRPAISDGDRLLHTYAQLMRRVSAGAGALRERLGLRQGDRVALAMKNCPAYLELYHTIWHAGLCMVPMNAKLHQREFAYILANSGARVCFVTSDLAEALVPVVDEVEGLERVICVDDAEYEALFRAEPVALQEVVGSDPAWIFYTSGTTGRPKGATLTHHSLISTVIKHYSVEPLSERDTIVFAAPLSHGGGIWGLSWLAQAGHLVVAPGQGFDPGTIFDLVDHYSDVSFFAAPTMLSRLTNHPRSASVKTENIKTILYGGAPMYTEDLKRALNRFGPRLYQGYGLGEAPLAVTGLTKAMHADRRHPRYEARISSVGIPFLGTEVRVVGDDGCERSTGETGEIVIRGDVVMRGYWANPEATAEAVRDGWLHTGDLGSFDEEGFLTLKDRSKDMIISGGTNIYPREIEEVLLQHEGVLETSVVGRPHADWGEEVVAFVVAREGANLRENELDDLCLQNIARFKRPKAYVFVENLPKSNYGKILKTELRKQLTSII